MNKISPRTEEQIAQEQAALMAAVAKGDALRRDAKLGTNGLACGNCHLDGSAGNSHTFPKFQTNLGKVGTLRGMINWCMYRSAHAVQDSTIGQ